MAFTEGLVSSCPLGKKYLAYGNIVGGSAFTRDVAGAILNDNLDFNTPDTGTVNPDGSFTYYCPNGPVGDRDRGFMVFPDGIGFWEWEFWDYIRLRQSFQNNVNNTAELNLYNYYAGQDVTPIKFSMNSNNITIVMNGITTRGTYSYGSAEAVEVVIDFAINNYVGDIANITMSVTDAYETITATGDISLQSIVIGYKADLLVFEQYAVTIGELYSYGISNVFPNDCTGISKYATVIQRKPQLPYTTNIKMLWDVNTLANSTVRVLDYGYANDQYTCTYNYTRETTQAVELATLAELTYRGSSVEIDTLTGESNPNFSPFGPHVSNVNPSVNIISYENQGQIDPFGLVHGFGLQIAPDDAIAYDTQGAICAGGGFRFGSLLDTELPEIEYRSEYKVNTLRLGSSISQNYNPSTAEHQYCILKWTCSKQNAKNILIEVIQNLRSLTFTMNAGDNYYPFGVLAGQGNFTVRISNPEIEVTHVSADTYVVSIEVVKC